MQGCYSFKGFSIDYTLTKTFSVETFGNKSQGAPPIANIQFTEQLKDRFRNSTRLANDPNNNGDIVLTGYISDFIIRPAAPRPGVDANTPVSALQQLEIKVFVSFKNKKEEKKDWEQTFVYPTLFPADTDFSSVQEQLLKESFDNIIEQIFNKAFSDW